MENKNLSNKNFIIIILVLVLALVILLGFESYKNRESEPTAQEQLDEDIRLSRAESEEEFWAENKDIQEINERNKDKDISEWSQEDLDALHEYQAKKREQLKEEQLKEEQLKE